MSSEGGSKIGTNGDDGDESPYDAGATGDVYDSARAAAACGAEVAGLIERVEPVEPAPWSWLYVTGRSRAADGAGARSAGDLDRGLLSRFGMEAPSRDPHSPRRRALAPPSSRPLHSCRCDTWCDVRAPRPAPGMQVCTARQQPRAMC